MTLRIELPKPISLNNAFRNVAGAGRRPTKEYTRWMKLADDYLLVQKAVKNAIKGPVEIHLTFTDKSKADGDNLVKVCIDRLVKHEIIEGDGPKIVKSISWKWGDVSGAVVEIKSLAEVKA